MSITLERWMPKKQEVMSYDNLDLNDRIKYVGAIEAAKGFNECRTEASKVEIGISKDKLIEYFLCDGCEYQEAEFHAKCLIATEDSLIVVKP